MLHINPNDESIKKALTKHFKAVRCLIWKKIGAIDDSENPKQCPEKCSICNSGVHKIDNIPERLKDLLNDDALLERLICGLPNDLLDIDVEIWEQLSPDIPYFNKFEIINKKDSKENPLSLDEKKHKEFISNLYDVFTNIFAYDSWFVSNVPSDYYGAYHLAQNLQRQSCTYCNRTYTATIVKDNNGKLTRPQFDHYFPKSKYPLLALSFYNLIPSCYICNSSVKGTMDFKLDTHVHPYVDDIIDKYSFTYSYQRSNSKYNIGFNVHDEELKSKIERTIEDFHLKEIFESHQSELDDLIKTKLAYSEEYLKTLRESFPLAHLSEQDVYRMAFGVELKEDDFHKRPLSKFKSDILKELGIIK